MSRKILLAGGNSGIGLQLIKDLSGSGHSITAVSRNGNNIEDLDNVHYYSADPADPQTKLELDLDSLDGFVYLPGTINLKPFNRLKNEDYMEDLRVNFLGAVNIMRQVVPLLKKGDHPSVVFLSTVAVQTGLPFHASISAAKGAIEGFTRAMAAELAPSVRVNAIAPSLTDTPLAERLLSTDSKKESSAERHPLKRVGTTEDIASSIKFLLSPESSWITGQVLKVDGGLSVLK